jgi:fused signal recognition particle receptor
MSFFSKLKERLFKSSSKLDEGLEAIVAEGRDEPQPAGTQAPGPEPVRSPEAGTAPEAVSAPPPLEAGVPDAPEPAAPEPDAPEPVAPEPDATETAPPPAVAPVVPPAALAEAVRAAPASEPEPTPPAGVPAQRKPEPQPAPPRELAPEPARPGLLGRLFGRGEAVPVARRTLDDAMLESLEELLIQADMGVETALRVASNMAEGRMGRRLSVAEIKGLLADEVTRIMEPVARPMPLYPKRPQVVLVVGVNGSGKTTTIGKLASQFRAAGKSVVIAAGDTFRAAAVEQLQIWGSRAGVPVLTAPEGSDPASLAFDAMTKAEADGADLLLIDTAGRLQNRQDLMEELAKIVRVIRKKDPSAPHNTILVLDATTGQNALSQVEIFRKLADVSGLVMTKLDGTAKGGVLVALADRFGLPIHAIGVGEQIDDLQPFDPGEFARALVGAES